MKAAHLALVPLLLCHSAYASVSVYSRLDFSGAILVPASDVNVEQDWSGFGVSVSDGINSSQGDAQASLSTSSHAMAGTANMEALSTRIQGTPLQPYNPAVLTWGTLTLHASSSGSVSLAIPWTYALSRDSLTERAEVNFFAIDQWYLLDSELMALTGNELEKQGSGWLSFQLDLQGGSPVYSIDFANYSSGGTAPPIPEPESAALLSAGLGVLWLLRQRNGSRAVL